MKDFLLPAHPWRHRGKRLLKGIFWFPYLPVSICWNLFNLLLWVIASPWYLYRWIRPSSWRLTGLRLSSPPREIYSRPGFPNWEVDIKPSLPERLDHVICNPEALAEQVKTKKIHTLAHAAKLLHKADGIIWFYDDRGKLGGWTLAYR